MSGPPREYYLPCTLGLEAVLAEELTRLGAGDVLPGRGGVTCAGPASLGRSACLWVRSGIRVQELLAEFEVDQQDDLYEAARAVAWERLLTPDHTLAVDATVRDGVITHSGWAALRTKDAVCDRLREHSGGRRPSVDRQRPDVPLKLLIKGRTGRLYRDWAGASLHKRGYRPVQVKSPLNEATAAGLLLLLGYDGQGHLLDPLCGSGTLLIEAAWMALDRAPGLGRRFAFQRWPDHDDPAWQAQRQVAADRVRRTPAGRFTGADRHGGALSLARKAAAAAGVGEHLRFLRADVAELVPPEAPDWVVTNPPYGERLGEGEDLLASWDGLARLLREGCPGARVGVLSGDRELSGRLRLKAEQRWPVRNGPLDCRLLSYRMHGPAGGSSTRGGEGADADRRATPARDGERRSGSPARGGQGGSRDRDGRGAGQDRRGGRDDRGSRGGGPGGRGRSGDRDGGRSEGRGRHAGRGKGPGGRGRRPGRGPGPGGRQGGGRGPGSGPARPDRLDEGPERDPPPGSGRPD